MEIYVNEKLVKIEDRTSLFQLKEIYKKGVDLIVYNGFPCDKDLFLQNGDSIVFIKKGHIPKEYEIEFQLNVRHTKKIQDKIKNSTVYIAGLGGLGSNAAVSLARIGIGKLVLVDYDVVELCNLNRQYYFIDQIGMKKTEALAETINRCNPFIKVETKNVLINKNNISSIFKDADLIIEALDDNKSKALLVNKILLEMKHKIIVASSGMAGYFSSNTIKTRKISDRFYLIGDEISKVKTGCGLMAPRVAIAANHEANMILRIILNENNV
ncbi:sulfur carrier protein ThiS adenylyltransferase ThiF [Clostridium niameyense]|uniref:Sulfur carrier protein ThiS adenylyltransferase ThiF n=1 Tax=Clostridium niameyense TaxID=1622073 RepID=A0A6M0RAZ8_9CLOT|nr:sulfur carrier protein ThiS adenylyltransferase ThiF [Clostridium niameyense]NEZ46840.1 sulfur carrier protein ThiS adenylyltransferase ThiF [Clostridium niameyense]